MHNLKENPSYRNRKRIYQNRHQAGKVLADMLAADYQSLEEGIILAIPSGGVPIGLELSKRLGLALDLVIVRKIQIPGNSEAGFGAMTLNGQVYLNQRLVGQLGLQQEQIEEQKEKVRRELKERNAIFRKNRPLPDFSQNSVIISDDGLASGYTMLAAISMLRELNARKIIVAVPTAPLDSIRRIAPVADMIYSPHIQEQGSFAVASAYREWHDLTRDEVLQLIS